MWNRLQAKLGSEQISLHLEIQILIFGATIKKLIKKISNFVTVRSSNSPQAGKAMHTRSGLT